ncbi:MAG: BspA family leucine-rich repeat surface protein, partial [Ruminiclostridium sp.]|nr:BspA family leucine-rich repeat surface protein [Ruminiclostridium sp.]
PLYLTLTDNGAAGTITNGVPGMVMVRKAWTAADSVAEEYLNFTSLSNLSWSVTVEVDKGNGWESAADIPYYIVYPYYTNGPITNSTGIQTNLGSNATVVLDLSAPGQETWKYRVTETDAYGSSQKKYSYYGRDGKTGYFQSTALVDQVTGTVKDDSLAVVKNAISGQQVVTYSKTMLGGTPDIGAELVYRVERYNGAEWEPAFGVPYLVAYGSPYNPPEQENATAQDGLITMTYNGAMPYVSFTDEIHLNYPVGKVGDLRLVEVAERTDPSWGSLVGYTGRDGSTGIYKDTANITGFVNGTGFTTLQVKKLMDDGTTGAGPFTFQLTQVIGQTGTAVGSGVGYTVYNVGEDTPLSTGVTDEKGQFTLLSGQYAILDVPEKTQWKVKELVTMPYELADTQVNGDQVTPDAGDASAGNVDLRSSMMLIPGKQLNALMSSPNPYAASITFGLKSDYPGISAQTGTPVDVNGSGSVMLYQTKVDSYRSYYYILGDDQIIANYDCSEMFRGLGYGGLTGIYGLERIDTSQVTNMSYMFNAIGNQNLTDLDLSGLDTSQVTDMSYMLGSNSQITYMDLSGWDTSQVKNMSYMFSGNNGLTTVDVSGWDTGSVTDMNHMFNYCNKLTTVDVSKWDTSQVKDMSYMFYNCNTLTTLDVSNWNTSQVKDMSYMFYVCRILRTPDVSKWDTSNVESMAGMFQGSGVSTPDVRNWNTGKVKSMASMFLESSLISLDVSEWDTGSVESMRYMFKSCVNLTALDVSKWDTRNVTDMSDMFNGCSRSLATLDVSKWDTGSVTSMFGMFRDCSKLTTLDVSGWNTGSVTNMNYMFKGCSKLTSLDLSSWNTAKVTSMGNMFNQCTALTTIYASDDLFVTGQVESSTSMFGSCSKLQGGAGTKYNSGKIDKTYARIDGGATKPGYFTAK